MKNTLKITEHAEGQVTYTDYGPDDRQALTADLAADLTRTSVKKIVIYPDVTLGYTAH